LYNWGDTAKAKIAFVIFFNDLDEKMVPVEGLEPPTFALQERCSTN